MHTESEQLWTRYEQRLPHASYLRMDAEEIANVASRHTRNSLRAAKVGLALLAIGALLRSLQAVDTDAADLGLVILWAACMTIFAAEAFRASRLRTAPDRTIDRITKLCELHPAAASWNDYARSRRLTLRGFDVAVTAALIRAENTRARGNPLSSAD